MALKATVPRRQAMVRPGYVDEAVNLSIDGTPVSVPPGTTILQAANKTGPRKRHAKLSKNLE